MLFFLLINVKMPTIVYEQETSEHFVFSWVEHDFFITSGPGQGCPLKYDPALEFVIRPAK